MGKFQMALPAPLRPENGAVKGGDDNAGWMFTRGHKFFQDQQCRDSEDFIASVATASCMVGGVFDGHGGTACPRTCANIIMPRMANSCEILTDLTSCMLSPSARNYLHIWYYACSDNARHCPPARFHLEQPPDSPAVLWEAYILHICSKLHGCCRRHISRGTGSTCAPGLPHRGSVRHHGDCRRNYRRQYHDHIRW